MPTTGAVLESTSITMAQANIIPIPRQGSSGHTTAHTNLPDDREVFKVRFVRTSHAPVQAIANDRCCFQVLHDCMKDVAKFRQYVYYLGTSCDTTKLRNKIQKLKERIHCSFYHQREVLGNGVAVAGS